MIMMTTTGAVAWLRAAREQARRERAAAGQAIERLRQRNREELNALAGRGAPVRDQSPGWPSHPPPAPRWYGVDDPEPAPAPGSQPGPELPPEDGWAPESWLL